MKFASKFHRNAQTARIAHQIWAESLETRRLLSTYYVSKQTGASDNNPGTQASPWLTVSKVNSTDLDPGDTVLFRGGDTWDVTSTYLQLTSLDAGSSGSPVTIGSYGTGRATLQSSSTASTPNALRISDIGNVRIENLILVGPGLSAQGGLGGSGLKLKNQSGSVVSNITIYNVEVSGWKVAGIFVADGSQPTKGYSSVLIDRANAHDNGSAGIRVAGPDNASGIPIKDFNVNITIQNSFAHDNNGYIDPAIDNNTTPQGSGIWVSNSTTVLITSCVAYNNGTTGYRGTGIWVSDSDSATIRYCESYENKATGSGNISPNDIGVDGGGFDLDGGVTNSIMEYNYSHDNDGAGLGVLTWSGGQPINGITIRYNVSVNDAKTRKKLHGYSGLRINQKTGTPNISNVSAYNNIVYMDASEYDSTVLNSTTLRPAAFESNVGAVPGMSIQNNVFFTTGSIALAETPSQSGQNPPVQILRNDWYSAGTFAIRYSSSTYGSVSAFANATGFETVNSTVVGLSASPSWIGTPDPGIVYSSVSFPVTVSTLQSALAAHYKLAAGSALVDAGASLSGHPSTDLVGSGIVDGTPDIGACEQGPRVLSIVYQHETLPPTFVITFSEAVQQSTFQNAISFVPHVSGNPVPAVQSVTWNNSIATVTLAQPTSTGRFDLAVPTNAITNASLNTGPSPINFEFFYLPGDANNDATVNFSDSLIVSQNYGHSGTTWSTGDFTGDGMTNFADLLIVSQNYGMTVLHKDIEPFEHNLWAEIYS